MESRPDLSPHLRPLRYCPTCGQRVAQQAETCFMCGAELAARRRGRLRLAVGDLLLLVVIVGIVFLWWTRSGEQADSSGPVGPVVAQASPTLTAAGSTSTPSPTPTYTQTPTPTLTPTPIIYTVKRGDTVERIAAEYGIEPVDLMIANGLTSDLIRVDEKLVIPPGPLPRGPDGLPFPTNTPTPVSAIYLVVVRTGDTLENIASRLGTTVDAIIKANESIEDADTLIQPGDQLVVPVGTVMPTPTPVDAIPPTATPVPTPTPTPGSRWPAPQLLGPMDEAEFRGGTVLLQWLSAGQLDDDEVYVVRVMPDGRPQDQLTAVTVGTSYRIAEEWLGRQTRRAKRFLWSVQVARDVRAIAGQAGGLRATSPSSQLRSFTWDEATVDG